jgi:hypothetical protein
MRAKDSTHEEIAIVPSLRDELARKIAAHIDVEGPLATAVPGLRLSRRSAPSECCSAAYEPELVVFAQGEKRITVGGATHVHATPAMTTTGRSTGSWP